MNETETGVVVGIDASEGSRHALRWALDEAVLRRVTLTVVHAWPAPYSFPGAPTVRTGDDDDDDSTVTEQRLAEELVERELDDADAGTAGVRLARRVSQGPPVPALLEAARHASLLVVGSRGRGGFKGLALGSVSQQCVLHSPCPVVIARRPSA